MRKRLLLTAAIATTIGCTTALKAESVKNKNIREAETVCKNSDAPKAERTISLKAEKGSKHTLQIISDKNLDKNLSISVMKSKNGILKKTINNGKISMRKHPQRAQAETTAGTYAESWEGWDGESEGWIPSDWKRISHSGEGLDSDYQWAASDGLLSSPTDGKYMEWINYNSDIAQDEWIVSPNFTPAANDMLMFDLCNAPYWMFLNFETFIIDFTNTIFDIQVQISTDGGNTWNLLWSQAEAAKAEYDEESIWDTDDWQFPSIDLSAYVGKNINIAFRYAGKDGNSVGLDNIQVRNLNPQAFYMRPEGYLIGGLTENLGSTQSPMYAASAYTQAQWYNYSVEATSCDWTFYDKNDNAYTTTETDPIVEGFPFGYFQTPTLTAKTENASNDYFWGCEDSENELSYIQAGGSFSFSNGTYIGAGNYDLNYGIANWRFDDNDYVFGNGTAGVDAIGNFFEKPASKYITLGFNFWLGTFSAPANTEFTLTIRRIDQDGYLADTIATARCFASDVKEPETGIYRMSFNNFEIPLEDGFVETTDNLIIEDAIFAELSGFNVEGVTLSAISQRESSPIGECNAYVYIKGTDSEENPVRKLLSAADFIGDYTSLLCDMDIINSYVHCEDTEFNAADAGESKKFTIDSYYSSKYWETSELPEWLTASFSEYDSETGTADMTLTAAALPSGTEGRSSEVVLYGIGADCTFHVSQGTTGIASSKISDVTITKSENAFNIKYSNAYTRAEVFSISGTRIDSYALPSTGLISIPCATFAKGVYLIRLKGEKSKTLRVIR